MHTYFSGIGGAGIGPLALIAKQAGYDVSGSDKQPSSYIEYLKSHGIKNISLGQNEAQIAEVFNTKKIDWFVYSSALNPNNPELQFARSNNIKISKRDEFLNHIISQKGLKLVAVAGTHGKTTTTAMIIWLLKQLEVPIGYSVGAKTSFSDMGAFELSSQYFIYECDEFDRNFLAFHPFVSLITGVSWDHHEIYPTRKSYQQAFRDFINQSDKTFLWQRDADYLGLKTTDKIFVLGEGEIENIKLAGKYNREDAMIALQTVAEITGENQSKLVEIINKFPGLSRRMEEIAPGLYSDYAHTPEKIRGAMSAALETAHDRDVIVIYEPLTNRRQHFVLDNYKDCFKGAKKVYWIPSYLAREEPGQQILSPTELIKHLSDPSIATPKKRDEELKKTIQEHLGHGDMVVGMAGGGGDSLDDWLRKELVQ